MSSAILTEPPQDDSFRPWHIFALLSMAAAAAIVWTARSTHPLSLLLLSAGVLASGFVGYTVFRALSAFFNTAEYAAPVPERAREALIREKALLLRSIKELEFDKSMGKIGESDYAEISGRLRARALALMQDIDNRGLTRSRSGSDPAEVTRPTDNRGPSRLRSGTDPAGPVAGAVTCGACGTANPHDAKFCKNCGTRLVDAP